MTAPTPPTEALDLLARALDATGHLVEGVTAEQWQQPTGCTGWTVRDLLSHVVGGNRLFIGILRGQPFPTGEQMTSMRDADHLGDDPVAAYHAVGGVLQDAFAEPGVLEESFTSPIGVVPGLAMLHLRVTELLVHGWDIAQATGQPAAMPDDLAELELRFTSHNLANVPADRSPFGSPQPVADDAPAIDRLAALLGRPVDEPAN